MALRLPQGSKSLPIKSNFCITQRILGESRGNSSFLLRLFAPRLLVRISLVGRWLWGEVRVFLKTLWATTKVSHNYSTCAFMQWCRPLFPGAGLLVWLQPQHLHTRFNSLADTGT